MGPSLDQSSSLEVEGPGLRRPSGRFFLWQPFSPPTFDDAGGVAVVFVGLEDRGNPATEVGRQGPTLAAGERGAETGVGHQVGQLKAGDIVGLGFDFELAASEASAELVRRHKVGALLEHALEGILEPPVLFPAAGFAHDIALSVALTQPKNEALDHHRKTEETMAGVRRCAQIGVPDFINVETVFHWSSIGVTGAQTRSPLSSTPPAVCSRASR